MANCDVTFMYDSQERSRVEESRVNPARAASRLRIEDMDDDLNEESQEMRAPIIGYEVIEQRQRFTVYKIQVVVEGKSWFVFRRYTDFVRLNETLQEEYPLFKFRLPGKRWFKDNYDPDFIEERARKLQLFISSLLNHSDISRSSSAREFFCIDDPPGPYDSIEESRAYCQLLEDQLEDAKQTISELTSELSATKSQLAQARVQQEALVSALRMERQSNATKGRRRNDGSVSRTLQHDLPDGYFRNINDKRVSSGSCGQETQSWNGEVEEDHQVWHGNVENSVHSAVTDRKKPAALKPRLGSIDDTPQSPLLEDDVGRIKTSTPVEKKKADCTLAFPKENDLTTEHPHTDGLVVENENRGKNPVCEDFKDSSDYLTNKDESDLKYQAFLKNSPGQNRRNASGETENNRVRNLKRDSGIIVDRSPTPST